MVCSSFPLTPKVTPNSYLTPQPKTRILKKETKIKQHDTTIFWTSPDCHNIIKIRSWRRRCGPTVFLKPISRSVMKLKIFSSVKCSSHVAISLRCLNTLRNNGAIQLNDFKIQIAILNTAISPFYAGSTVMRTQMVAKRTNRWMLEM